jgi:L-ribulose-5-phosphate 4-epimerase
MTLEAIKKTVARENKRLPQLQLVILTEGNVSEISPDRKFFVIKPSGVTYDELTHTKTVVVDMKTGLSKNKYRPSTDTPTHWEIYKRFPEIGGIVHTHSPYATMFAQMQKPIPCYGTTHADLCGEIPVTRHLTDKEIMEDYEGNTGKAICEVLKKNFVPCVLVPGHGPFTFGKNAKQAVEHAQILEKIAMMAMLGDHKGLLKKSLFEKHHDRKHGKNQYYGQAR